MQCPTCKKPVDASDDAPERKSFPFCSERCKLIDLGKWLDGVYQIPVEPGDSESDELDEGPLDAWVDPRLKRREEKPSRR